MKKIVVLACMFFVFCGYAIEKKGDYGGAGGPKGMVVTFEELRALERPIIPILDKGYLRGRLRIIDIYEYVICKDEFERVIIPRDKIIYFYISEDVATPIHTGFLNGIELHSGEIYKKKQICGYNPQDRRRPFDTIY